MGTHPIFESDFDCLTETGMANRTEPNHFIVRNIPKSWRSHHLRNYFYHSVQKEHFATFHFKHRSEFTKFEGDSCQTSCCVIELAADVSCSFLALYNRRNWVFLNGKVLREKCIITRFQVGANNAQRAPQSLQEMRQESRSRTDEQFTESDAQHLPELNPPRYVFPRGNVGTTDDEFRRLISTCRLPTSVMKSLKLELSRTKPFRRYQRLPHHYNDQIVTIPERERIVHTKDGHDIPIPDKVPHTEKETTSSKVQVEMEVDMSIDTEVIAISSEDDEEDDFGMEGWEIHQALNDDASLSRRNHTLTEENIQSSAGTKERAFEADIELTWEKGGSGLVFYTDQAYWKEKTSDGDIFDEEGFVQWDQDNSAFYDPHGGDKDAKDFVNMQRHRLRRAGIPEAKLSTSLIQSFGGKILKSQGWSEGGRVGLGDSGLHDPICPEYRHPKNVRGLGYRGVKIKDKKIVFPRRERTDGPVKISTIFDDLRKEDELGELTHRRAAQTRLKRRLFDQKTADLLRAEVHPRANVGKEPTLEIENAKPNLKINSKLRTSEINAFVKQPFLFGGVLE